MYENKYENEFEDFLILKHLSYFTPNFACIKS